MTTRDVSDRDRAAGAALLARLVGAVERGELDAPPRLVRLLRVGADTLRHPS